MTAVVARIRRPAAAEAAGWSAVAAIALGQGVTWWSLLFLPLGDSHDGRINGRFALHVRNFWESGLAGSGFLTDVSPYPTGTYAHHPPLANVTQVLISAFVGEGEWQVRLLGYASGVATVVALAWLARTLGLGWAPTLAALAATTATPMFWLYARLGPGFWLPVVLVTLAVRQHRGTGSVRALLVVGGLCAVLSWEALAVAALVAGWLAWQRASATAGRALALVVAAGSLLTAVWILSVGDVSELASHAADRVNAPGIEPGEFFAQQWWFYSTLFPWWYLVLVVPAVLAGLTAGAAVRRVVVGFLVVGLAFAFGLPEAAYIHDYWTKILLVPFMLGLAALVARIPAPGVRSVLAVVAGVALVSWLAGSQRAWFEDAYFEAASDAGRVLQAHAAPPDQETAWVIGAIAVPRWMSWYWDLPVEPLVADGLDRAAPDDLVLLRWDRLPAWAPPGVQAAVVAETGRYALVQAAELQE